MAPNPPIARRAPAKPWRASIVVTGDGAPKWPSTPIRSERPSGSWGALLDIRDAPLARPWVLLDLRSEEHTSELQSRSDLVCRLLLEKKKNNITPTAKTPTTSYETTNHRI